MMRKEVHELKTATVHSFSSKAWGVIAYSLSSHLCSIYCVPGFGAGAKGGVGKTCIVELWSRWEMGFQVEELGERIFRGASWKTGCMKKDLSGAPGYFQLMC